MVEPNRTRRRMPGWEADRVNNAGEGGGDADNEEEGTNEQSSAAASKAATRKFVPDINRQLEKRLGKPNNVQIRPNIP